MDSELEEPLFPPKGRWVLCGYGRFGKAVQQFLSYEGIESTIIEADPDGTDAPPDTIRGRGTEADTLTEAGIKTAAGIIAGTDDDANNLSIIMTARDLNDGLFTVARQNRQENQAIFEAARLDIVMQRSDLIAREIITRVTNPLLATFLSMMAGERDEESCNVLASRISGLTASGVPRVWTLAITKADASAVAITLFHGGRVSLEELLLDSRHQERHDCLPRYCSERSLPGSCRPSIPRWNWATGFSCAAHQRPHTALTGPPITRKVWDSRLQRSKQREITSEIVYKLLNIKRIKQFPEA